jgi:hypothetical protein
MMQRRRILSAMCLAVLAAAGVARAAEEGAAKQILELRLYTVAAGEKRQRLVDFLAKVAIPAWNRIGIETVGVFEFADGKRPDLYVLLPHKSLEAFATSRQRLLADAAFLKAGAPYLDLPKKDPLYRRVESSVMLAFDQCPKVEVPKKAETRVFQLRTYESHSLKKADKKIDMFNAGGEIALFRECGMQPVFFGQTLAGAKMPNLTYMLVFENDAARQANWKKFIESAGWQRLKSLPVYRDTVSGITNLFLRPIACSQL